jgi:hypothetical protein
MTKINSPDSGMRSPSFFRRLVALLIPVHCACVALALVLLDRAFRAIAGDDLNQTVLHRAEIG